MISVTALQMCHAVSGTLYGSGEISVTALSTDSRSIEPGVWFIPIKGERFDGHDYIDMALEKGAAGCFCSSFFCSCFFSAVSSFLAAGLRAG